MDFAAVSKQLRWLTKERDSGSLSPSKYRRARGSLLDSLVGLTPRAADADMTQPRAAAKDSPARPPESPSATGASVEASPAGGAGRPIAIAAAAAAVALVAAALMWQELRPTHSAPPRTITVQAVPGVAPAASVNVESLMTDFLRQDDWRDAAVSGFNESWRGLSDDDVVAALGNVRAQELSHRLSEQLQKHARRDSAALPPLEPNSPLLIMAGNLKVSVPDAAVGSASVSVAAQQPSETAQRAASTVAPAVQPSSEASQRAATTVPGTDKAPVMAANPPTSTGGKSGTAGASSATAATAAASAVSTAAASAPAAAAPGINESPRAAPPSASSDPCAETKLTPRRRSCADPLPDGNSAPVLRVIKPDSFMMGSEENPDEQPVHAVKFARPFALMETEVSAGDYAYFCQQTHRPRPAAPWDGDTLPVVNVSWNDAHDYAAWLSKATGQQYRLPTEAEWEFAARAGTSGEPVLNPASEARYSTSGMTRTSPVSVDDSSYKANAWGMRHMFGNVREWVEDAWSPDYSRAPADGGVAAAGGNKKIVRGGSFKDGPSSVRPGARVALDADTRDAMTGFRLVRVIHSP
jgi:formylglycine-generating enzyme required for sulfatase activity